MRFGQTHVLKTAKGKLAAGALVLLIGALAAFGIRQDRAEKRQ